MLANWQALCSHIAENRLQAIVKSDKLDSLANALNRHVIIMIRIKENQSPPIS